jgi:hypothetical protein
LSGTVADVLHAPYAFVHHLEEDVHHALGAVGGVAGWLVNTVLSAVLGLVVGGLVLALMHLVPQRNKTVHNEEPKKGRDEPVEDSENR